MAVQPVRVFFSYAQRDAPFRDELETHLSLLRRNGLIASWDDRQILAGESWEEASSQQVEEAELFLLLVSSSFLASEYIHSGELRTALTRHAKGLARVVPILVRPVDLSGSEIAKLQALPRNGKPVSTWANQDEAWLEVVQGIRAVVQSLRDPGAGSRSAASTSPRAAAQKNPVVAGVAGERSPDPSRERVPTVASLRQALNEAIRDSASFDAFCLDHFSQIAFRFTSGMERTLRTNLLLQVGDRQEILAALRKDFSEFKYDEIIRYESS